MISPSVKIKPMNKEQIFDEFASSPHSRADLAGSGPAILKRMTSTVSQLLTQA